MLKSLATKPQSDSTTAIEDMLSKVIDAVMETVSSGKISALQNISKPAGSVGLNSLVAAIDRYFKQKNTRNLLAIIYLSNEANTCFGAIET